VNPAVKEKWVNALATYPQTRMRLRSDTGFCCLGVLCDLYAKETGKGEWKQWSGGGWDFRIGNQGSSTSLPWQVAEWAGLDSSNPLVAGLRLSDHNDGYDYIGPEHAPKSFEEIAHLIQEGL